MEDYSTMLEVTETNHAVQKELMMQTCLSCLIGSSQPQGFPQVHVGVCSVINIVPRKTKKLNKEVCIYKYKYINKQ